MYFNVKYKILKLTAMLLVFDQFISCLKKIEILERNF